MIPVIADIASYMDDHGIGNYAGDAVDPSADIVIGEFQQGKESDIMLVEAPSIPPDAYVPVRHLNFEVWVRYTNLPDAYARLHSVFALLDRLQNVEMLEHYVYFIAANGDVENMDRDVEGKRLLRQTYRMHYRQLNAVS